MTPTTQPLALTATYLALLQPRRVAPAPAAAPPAPTDAQPAAAPRGRYIDMLV